jgi:hypothetical protein
MAKVITVSRKFPSSHPKAGQPTYFVEKIWNSLGGVLDEYRSSWENYQDFKKSILWSYRMRGDKHHTVRLGRRWQTGDMASIRTWGEDVNPKSKRSGPYHSKQIVLAPDVEVAVTNIVIECTGRYFQPMKSTIRPDTFTLISSGELAQNDGLSLDDFKDWFNPKGKKQEIEAQIICWNKNIKY